MTMQLIMTYKERIILGLAILVIQAQSNTKQIPAFLGAAVMLTRWLGYEDALEFPGWLSSSAVCYVLAFYDKYILIRL